jgi:recombination protein RecT
MTTDKKEPATMKTFLERNLPAKIKEILPEEMRLDRFMRIAYAALVRTPKLEECTPFSVLDCLIRCSQVGLEPDGRMCHLVPFNQYDKSGRLLRVNATFIIDYKGIVTICRRSGKVADIQAEVVHKNDEFDFEFGTSKFLRHVPALDDDPGPLTGVWSMVTFITGEKDFRVWSKRQIDANRVRSKARDSGPWVTNYEEMAKKALFKNQSKWLPFDSETTEKINSDDDVIDIEAERVTRRLPAGKGKTFADTDGFGDAGALSDASTEPPDANEPPQEGNPAMESEPPPEHKTPKGSLFK